MQYLYIFAILLALAIGIKFYLRPGKCSIKLDLTGKVAIITGGNDGIGKQTALQLAKQKCTVIIASRDKNKSQQAVKNLIKQSNNPNIQSFELDLSELESIKYFALLIAQKYNKIDYLINNAGIAAKTRTVTKQNLEKIFAVNHLGHFYLTYLLFQNILRSPQPRIINVSAHAHRFVKSIDWQNINFQKQFSGSKAYAQSKLFNNTFTKILARKISGRNQRAKVVALHPGIVHTQIVLKSLSGFSKILFLMFYPIYYFISKNPKEGAQTTIYTVLSPQIINGGYYADCKRLEMKNKLCSDKKFQQQLWEYSQKLLKIKFDV